MCDGSTRAIDQVKEGEWVWAPDEKTGAVECRQVVAPYANPDRAIIELELVDEQGLVEVIETTDNHPFFVEGQGFTRVDELLLGDRIPSGDGSVLEVERIYLTGRIEQSTAPCRFATSTPPASRTALGRLPFGLKGGRGE